MKKVSIAVVVCAFLVSSSLLADIAVTDRGSTVRYLTSGLNPAPDAASPATRAAQRAANQAKRDAKLAKRHHSIGLIPAAEANTAERAVRRAANQAKRDAKIAKRHHSIGLKPATQSFVPHIMATGSKALIDASGLQYFINTNITFSTSSSASGAASEASYTAPVVASTNGGGTTMSTLSDMFDGYGAICVSLTGATGPCQTGNASYAFFNQNGPAAFDATVPAVSTCMSRQVAYPSKVIGGLSVTRKVFVPTNDQFIRWMNIFTNTSGAPITFNMITSNNLGSDSNTRIVSSSSGDNVAQLSDTWVSTFQNYSGTTSSDPRIGHVLQGSGAASPVSLINFADGDDNPYWGYTMTLAPGQTKMIVNFATGQGTKAAANAKAAALALLPTSATQCMSATELGQVVNFVTATDLSITKTTTTATAFGTYPINYTLAVQNLGTSPAMSLSVVDTLPAGATFLSASGTGWTCGALAQVVTCTRPTLAPGAAPQITLSMTVPPVTSPGTLSGTSTVSSVTTDPVPANNTSTANTPVLPGASVPALGTWMLMALAATLGLMALVRRT